jgi:hypothetical protein
MDDVPLWQTMLGFAGLAVWGILCGLPALVLYSLAAKSNSGMITWVVLAVVLLVWFPLVTALCIWAVATLIGINLT